MKQTTNNDAYVPHAACSDVPYLPTYAHRTYGIVQKSNGKLELDDHDDIIPCAPDD